MGRPMATRLIQAGHDLLVWNRSPEPIEALTALGAVSAPSPSAVFAGARTVIVMLANEQATDAVLERQTHGLTTMLAGHVVISMGTTSPEYSRALGEEISAAGATFVEAPVSGSQVPAQTGQLVAMISALGPTPELESLALDRARALLSPLARQVVACGPVPNALMTKLASNYFLITQVASLAESFAFAQAQGLDLEAYGAVITNGPLASDVGRQKLAKLLAGDFSPHSKISDVAMNSKLVAAAANGADLSTPMLDAGGGLFRLAEELGFADQDMAAVLKAIHSIQGKDA